MMKFTRRDWLALSALAMTPGPDCVTTRFRSTNQGKSTWKQEMTFNCFQCDKDHTIRDNDCLRTWVRTGGEFKRLVELPCRDHTASVASAHESGYGSTGACQYGLNHPQFMNLTNRC